MLGEIGDTDALGGFALECQSTLAPPGSCGDSCNEESFACLANQVRVACCEEDHECVDAVEGTIVAPSACGYECSLVLPGFLEQCRPLMASAMRDTFDAAALRQFDAAASACEDQDIGEVLDILYQLRHLEGCFLDTSGVAPASGDNMGHRRAQSRRLQFGGSLFTHESCPLAEFQDGIAEVDRTCCPSSAPCSGNVPDSCSADCAIVWSNLFSRCRGTLQQVAGDSLSDFESFIGVCQTLDVGSLLSVAGGASCPAFRLGRTIDGLEDLTCPGRGRANDLSSFASGYDGCKRRQSFTRLAFADPKVCINRCASECFRRRSVHSLGKPERRRPRPFGL